MARVDAVQKRFSQLVGDMKRLERDYQKSKKRADLLQKEKDAAKSELNKANSLKEKLEKLCRELQKDNNSNVFPVRAELQKRIPAGAGLGGGSSDGARMLLGLNSLWSAGREANSLSGFAARFGSDLPFLGLGMRKSATRPANPAGSSAIG